MNKLNLLSTTALLFLLVLSAFTCQAEELWEMSYPGDAKIHNKISLKQNHLQLHVPSSLSGRTVKNFKTTFKADISNTVRYTHNDSDIELRGKSSRMDMEYQKDILDVQIFKSHQSQSGASSCMDCHGSELPRTLATIGVERTIAEASPYAINNAVIKLNDAKSNALRGEINHWMTHNLMLKAGLKIGNIEQGKSDLDANCFFVGLGGYLSEKASWKGDLNISKVETYDSHKTLTGEIDFKLSKYFKVVAGGGAFLDGYTQFGTEFAEMGMLINAVAKSTTKLPSLFNTLKNDRFGYWNLGLEYEYQF